MNGGTPLETFIRSDQYHLIKDQTQALLNGHLTSNDQAVTSALTSMAQEKVIDAFDELTVKQKQIIQQVNQIKDEGDALFFLSRLKQYIIPFPILKEQQIKRLFPKVKRLHVPSLDYVDWHELSYFAWNDPGSHRKYMVVFNKGKLIGLQGHFTPSRQSGICSICHEHEDIGLFTTTKKGKNHEQTITRGNYICQNSEQCNYNLKSLSSLNTFIERLIS